MEVLDALNLGELTQYFAKMAMFPVFDLAYYIVSILYLKYEPGSVEVSRRSPVASWLCAMLYCFGSYILADIMLGHSPIDYFHNNSHILLASAVWEFFLNTVAVSAGLLIRDTLFHLYIFSFLPCLRRFSGDPDYLGQIFSFPLYNLGVFCTVRYLIFYCPLNLFYKCVAFLPIKLVLVGMKEVVRTRKIAAGVHHAHHAYHHGFFIMIITGYVKGSGVALMSNFEQLLRGVWRPETNEILNMSFPTKASLYGAVLFTLQEAHWLPVSKGTLICLFTLFMATSKVVMTARHSHGSPFTLVESWVSHLLFGSPLAVEDAHNHHYAAAAAASAPVSPAKTKEELSEGTRKRKVKKAE